MFEKAQSTYEKESFPEGMYPVVLEDMEPYEFEGTDKDGNPTTIRRIAWKLRVRDGNPHAGKLMETSGPTYLTSDNRSGQIIMALLGTIPDDPTQIDHEALKGQKLHVQWVHGEFNGRAYEGVKFAMRFPDDTEDGKPPPVPAGTIDDDEFLPPF